MRGVPVCLILLFLASTLAGCINGEAQSGGPEDASADRTGMLAGPALWNDPQNTPHPAYGWPTLSSPPTGPLPPYWEPMPAATLPTTITGLVHEGSAPTAVRQGGGNAVFGSIAYVPGFSTGRSYIVDLSDPASPALLANTDVPGSERGAAIIAYPDGRLASVVSTSAGFNVWDITDPTAPEFLTAVHPSQGGHKVGVVPGTPIVYNAASDGGSWTGGGGRHTEIYDLTDPDAPELVQEFDNGYSCHHVYFWNAPDGSKQRAICAGVTFTQIWDTTDPRNPEVIVSIPMHHGIQGVHSLANSPYTFSHFAGISIDGDTLLVGDEMGGGGLPPGCAAGVHSPVGSASTPAGALWFYDITDETDPVLSGWFSPGHHVATNSGHALSSCTAHHGRLVPAEGRDMIAMSFYGAGVVLIDFTLPAAPIMVDQYNTGANTWETWYHNGWLVTGDLSRGLDVLSFR